MRAESLEATIRRLGDLGYESIEISGEPYLYDVSAVRRQLAENGVSCWGAVALMMGERSLIAPDESRRARSVRYVKDCITLVKELDGHIMTVVPSTVGLLEPQASSESEWRWAIESMRDIYEHAWREGVRVGIEPINRFETYFINRCEQALALAQETGPECGVVLDTFHMNIEEPDLLEAIRRVGDRLVDMHVADSNRLACGQGHLDWPAIVEALIDIDYDGALSVECVPPVDRTPVSVQHEESGCTSGVSERHRQFVRFHGGGFVTDEVFDDLAQQCASVLRPLMRSPVTSAG